ncbi:unnamed protein product, partial [marine sediment metagenome]
VSAPMLKSSKCPLFKWCPYESGKSKPLKNRNWI